MARWLAWVIVLASVLGQADAGEPAEKAKPQAAEPKKAEYHETLEPLAPYVGHWRGERKSATGDLKSVRNDVYKWIHNGRALHLAWTDEAPDGELRASASYIFYW